MHPGSSHPLTHTSPAPLIEPSYPGAYAGPYRPGYDRSMPGEQMRRAGHPSGDPLFTAAYAVRLDPVPDGTRLELKLQVVSSTTEAAPAIAGMRPGWEGSLDRLARALT